MSALVIGDGIAGITAATWLSRYEAEFRWVGGRWGGILNEVYNPIIDLPGMAFENGPAAVAGFHAWDDGALPTPEPVAIHEVRRDAHGFIVVTADGEIQAQHVLLCTGTQRRKLGIDGEAEALGDWVVMSTAKDAERFAGKRVVMIGGGDAGVEGALNALDAGASEVTLVTRSELRAQRQFVERLLAEPKITWFPERATPTRFASDGDDHWVELDSGSRLPVDLAVVRVGVVPVHPLLDPMPGVDAHGFIRADDRGQSTVPGLFAAGDVTSTPLRSIATSMGDATRAARTIAELQGIWSPHG